MEFYDNGKSIILEKSFGEDHDLFLLRGNIIIKNISDYDNFDMINKLSQIYINYNYKNCVYSKNLLDKIKKLKN